MPNLYEINTAVANILRTIEPDPDTGEVKGDVQMALCLLDSLQMEKRQVLEELAKSYQSEVKLAKDCASEISRLQTLKSRREKQAERIKTILAEECAGERTDLGVARVWYRHAKALNIENEDNLIGYLEENNPDFLKFPKPELKRLQIVAHLKDGETLPGCTFEDKTYCFIQ